MRKQLFALLMCLPSIGLPPLIAGNNWPGFRGIAGVGVVQDAQLPHRWDATDPNDPAVRWRVHVPGLGHGSPVVFGNKIFLTTAIASDGRASLKLGRGGIKAAEGDGEQTWAVLCYDKTSGALLWQKDVKTGEPRATRHAKATHANTSVAVDEDRVVAFFGSEGLYCLDHDGELLWEKDLGIIDVSKYDIGWGYASSPVIHDDVIVLVCDDPNDPYLVTLDLETGNEVWRKPRQGDCERSWSTALVHATNESAQVVVNGWPWIVSYDLASGEEIWRIEGGGDNPTPTPFAIDHRIYVTNSHGGESPIIVVDENAKGNLTEDADAAAKSLIWRTDRGGSYMSTPIVVHDRLYLGNTNGVIRCFDALSGDRVFEERLGRDASIYSSLVAAGNQIYCPSEDGTVYVLRASDRLNVLSKNPMGEPCLASPAISGNVLLIRTTKSLVAIATRSALDVSDENH
ncbi:MAG: PQQ-binding-like beta-propeller repeat protein [Planctomycetota bacterium]